MKQTALHRNILLLKPKMTEFRGWQVPARFAGVAEEHRAVRHAAGLFDIGFLGRIEISGPGAAATLERVFTRQVGSRPDNTVVFGLLCTDAGMMLSDALLFRLPPATAGGSSRFLLTVNPETTAAVLEHLGRHARKNTEITDRTDFTAHLSLQGPAAAAIVERIAAPHFKKLRQRQVKAVPRVEESLQVARVGGTGEDGYEFFIAAGEAPMLWDLILATGKEAGIMPCGLESRHILRLEMGYPLYGNDMDGTRTPFEAGLGRFVDVTKDFIGKDALQKIRKAGVERQLVGLAFAEQELPRIGGSIFVENHEIGSVTNAALSPSLRTAIGLGYVLARYAGPGQEIDVESKDREVGAKIAALPFYRKK